MIKFAISKSVLLAMLLGFSIFLTGCASTKMDTGAAQDPFESMNRSVFEFNEFVDEKFIEPVARGYQKYVPAPLVMIVGNVFSNADDVVVTANSLLQLNFESAAASATRLLINTTFGRVWYDRYCERHQSGQRSQTSANAMKISARPWAVTASQAGRIW